MKRTIYTGRKKEKRIKNIKLFRPKIEPREKGRINPSLNQRGKLFSTVLIGSLILGCVCFLSMAGKKAYTISTTPVIDWGVHYETKNALPKGNASEDYLKQYDAYFTGSSDVKVLYLTFDAGYENGYTSGILDTLAEHNVKAAFFLVGHYFESAPAIVKRMVSDGHTICSHSYAHSDPSLMSREEFSSDIKKLEETALNVSGVPLAKYYRPPAGKFNEQVLQNAKAMGYKTILWSVAYADWDNDRQMSMKDAINTLSDRVHPGAVILLHATSKTNMDMLSEFLTQMKQEGYRFAALEEL